MILLYLFCDRMFEDVHFLLLNPIYHSIFVKHSSHLSHVVFVIGPHSLARWVNRAVYLKFLENYLTILVEKCSSSNTTKNVVFA